MVTIHSSNMLEMVTIGTEWYMKGCEHTILIIIIIIIINQYYAER